MNRASSVDALTDDRLGTHSDQEEHVQAGTAVPAGGPANSPASHAEAVVAESLPTSITSDQVHFASHPDLRWYLEFPDCRPIQKPQLVVECDGAQQEETWLYSALKGKVCLKTLL